MRFSLKIVCGGLLALIIFGGIIGAFGGGGDATKENDSPDKQIETPVEPQEDKETDNEPGWGNITYGTVSSMKSGYTDANSITGNQTGDSTTITNVEEVVLEELPEIVPRKVPNPSSIACSGGRGCINALDRSIDRQLLNWMNDNGHVVKTLTEEPLKPLTGYYAYPYTVLSVGSSVTLELNLGLSQIEIPMEKMNIQRYIAPDGEVSDELLKEDYQGLAIIGYSDEGKIVSSEFYTRDKTNSAKMVQHALLNANIRQESNESDKSYENLTVEDWKARTIKEVERIRADGRLPHVMVTSKSKFQYRGDFQGTHETILLALVPRERKNELTDNKTHLRSYDGQNFSIDFKGLDGDNHHGIPMWIHVFTQDGRITTSMVSAFDGANMKFMAQGMADAVDEIVANNRK